MTFVDALFLTLVRAHVAASAAILLILALRPLARSLVGAELTYRLWMLAPFAATISLFPTLPDMVGFASQSHAVSLVGWQAPSGPLLTVWAAGAFAWTLALTLAERRFRRLARQGLAGPAVMGLGWPQLVVPRDYRIRFTDGERVHIRRHEEAHMERRDPQSRLLMAAMQVLGWCNPLVHIAVDRARLDQEIACDATVMEHRAEGRKAYAATLLKAHATQPASRFACAWSDGRRDLELRLLSLGRPKVSHFRYVAGAGALAALVIATAAVVWTTGPGVGTSAHAITAAFAGMGGAR